MFNKCNNLKKLILNNFITINCKTDSMLSFGNKNECSFITDNKSLEDLFDTSP